ncbi:MAG: SSS family solute:Na+ symporter [Saprospiraceae bacterium]|jgi:SSS family solute:Na+ symporter
MQLSYFIFHIYPMHLIDWIIMATVLTTIVGYGVWKTRKVDNVKSYLMGDRDLPWWTIGLSVMATQASAITFLSTPGQAFDEGMGFAQFYFGMPIAMVLLCIFVLPIYYKLNVFTAYEYLEGRFDLKTRTLTACLFLVQRGMAAGITIYAPAIILSSILGWPLFWTNVFIGFVVIFYTVMGGTKAVSVTQKQQMIVILGGMIAAAIILVNSFPENIYFSDAVAVAGKTNKLEIINFDFDLNNKYTIWTGMLGGVFLFLSYFGTDQSQVQRYLSGKSLTQSRLGLLFNGIFKVPMQFFVLFTGVLVFIFFQFEKPPLHFNNANVAIVQSSEYAEEYNVIESEYNSVFEQKEAAVYNLVDALRTEDELAISTAQIGVNRWLEAEKSLQKQAEEVILKADNELETRDTDYIFITFIMNYLPIGMVGLLIAVIFSAAMSSTSSELNALATTTVIDIYRRSINPEATDKHYLNASKSLTVLWGLIALTFATFASLFDNLIEAVNIVGSVFYGTILGIFVVAFFLKKIKGNAVFYAAIVAEIIVITIFLLDRYEMINLAYLWLNFIGCLLVMFFAWLFSFADKGNVASVQN